MLKKPVIDRSKGIEKIAAMFEAAGRKNVQIFPLSDSKEHNYEILDDEWIESSKSWAAVVRPGLIEIWSCRNDSAVVSVVGSMPRFHGSISTDD